MATSTIAGRVHELGVKLEPPSEVEIKVSEDVNSSVENVNDNGRSRCLVKCFAAAVTSAAASACDGPSTRASASPLDSVESCHEFKSKTDKIREAVEQGTSEESKKKIARLLADIQQLPDVEKLLLYLRLPSGSKVEVDPLKQSFVSSLGNRYEVTQTVTWIQTHLEEDVEVSLPKQEVYDGYCDHCNRVEMKPLSTADFGKVMKQVFPNVRPRRLGTRGNSRYCYAGLRKKVLLETPRLPDLSLTHEEPLEETDRDDLELNGAISFLIREWAEKLLERKFGSLKELALHVVEKGYVAGHSVATFTMLSYAAPTGLNGKGVQPQYPQILNQCDGSKHRETRIQLQRKLHERESIREQKKRLMEERIPGDKTASHSATAFATTSSTLSMPKLSTRKNQSSKSAPPDTLRRLLSNESNAESKKRLGDSCCSTCDTSSTTVVTPKVEKNGNVESACKEKAVHCEMTTKTSPLHKRQSVAAKSSSESQPVGSHSEPVRRRSGGEIRSPRPSPLVSGWATPTPDVPPTGATCNKSGKVMISRVRTRSNSSGGGAGSGSSSSQGSKLCFTPSTNIIILPTISAGVPISTEFNGSGGGANGVKQNSSAPSSSASNGVGGQISKYKLIQPKPCSLSDAKTGSDCAKDNTSDKDTERVTKTSRRGSNSSLKRSLDEKDDRELGKSSKSRKRCRQPSDGDKLKGKRVSTQGQQLPQQRMIAEEAKCAPKCSEDDINEGPQGEMNITTLEQDALLDYLNDSTPSVEQEDELVRYFGNGDEENNVTGGCEVKHENCDVEFDDEQSGEQLSQLRQLLERNFKNKFTAADYQTVDGQEAVARKDTSAVTWAISPGANHKDNTPTLRLLLGEQRHGSSSDIQSVLTGNNQSAMMEGSSNVTSGGISGESQVVDVCVTSASTQVDSWRQSGTCEHYVTSATRNSDEILMSSDSSSGCYPPISGGPFMSLEGLFERGHDHSLNQQQQQQMIESGNQFNSGVMYTGPVVSYPQLGNGHGNSSVPPSPNTRRRAFNFQPISPQSTPVQETHSRTQSPLPYQPSGGPVMSAVRSSYGAGPPSATSSPFVSPRSTPSSLCRSRHNSGQAMNTAPSTSTIGTPRATPHSHHVATDQSSCLPSPFISPHPTPVPFSRSRHNSSQQQLQQQQQRFGNNNNSSVTCTPTGGRSRHPSELMVGGPILSPGGSAPMSPLEVQQQSHPSITHYCDTIAAENHFSNNRSRHNSSSGYVSLALPPPPPPLPPQSLLNISPPNLSPLGPPPPPLPHKITSDVVDNIQLMNSWPISDVQGTDWSTNRQIDPRLLSRQRHASVGSHFIPFHSNCPPSTPSSLQGLNPPPIVEQPTREQEVTQQLIRQVEQQNELQGVASRSRSVPIYQMLQHMIQQSEPSDEPIRDVMMSHSYPATPTGQSTTFNFGGNSVSGGGGVESGTGEIELELNEYQTTLEEEEEEEQRLKNRPYQQQRQQQHEEAVVANDGNNLSASLDLPMDQYQNIIPQSPLDDYMLQEFPAVELELDQCYAASTATQH